MDGAEEFIARVEAVIADAPYVVERHRKGFWLIADLHDQRWHSPAGIHRRSTSTRFKVGLRPGERVFTILDVLTTVASSGGVFRFSMRWSSFRGRVWGRYGVLDWGRDSRQRSLGLPVAYRFDPGEGHAILRAVGAELGWRERWPPLVVGALVMAVIGIGGALASIVANVVIALS